PERGGGGLRGEGGHAVRAAGQERHEGEDAGLVRRGGRGNLFADGDAPIPDREALTRAACGLATGYGPNRRSAARAWVVASAPGAPSANDRNSPRASASPM